MALIEIYEDLLDQDDSMDALKEHFGGIKELRYLRKPQYRTRTFYVDTPNFGPSDVICPVLQRDDKGNVTVIKENYENIN